MSISKTSCFLSYAHKDDTFDFLANLRNDLCDEYRVVTGDELEIFFDRESIEWGDRWEKSIRDSLDTAGIFMPVMSPSYFQSTACMGELSQYLEKVKSSGANDLILPLLYSDPSHGKAADDSMLAKLMRFQYQDIHDMRFVERGSGKYCWYLNELANRIFRAQESLEQAAFRVSETSSNGGESVGAEGESDDEAPGGPFYLDAFNELSGKMDPMAESAGLLVADIEKIGNTFSASTTRINDGCSPKQALAILADLSKKLDPVADDMLVNSQGFSSLVVEVDPLLRVFAESKSRFGSNSDDALQGLDELVANAVVAKDGIDSLHGALKDTERFSRVLYKPFKKIQRASAICSNAIDIVISWGDLDAGASGGNGVSRGEGGSK